jgi:glycosyltransferase involved in cell wall biosynthesis
VFRLFSRLNVGGPAVHVILLTAGLRPRGYRTQLVVGRESAREGNLVDLARSRAVDCVQLDALGREIHVWRDVRAFWRLCRLIREFRPHVVHTHTAKAGALGRLAAWLSRVPVVVHTYHGHVLRSYFGPSKTALFRLTERALARLTDALVAVSPAVKADLVSLGVARESKIRVVPLGLDLHGLAETLPRGVLRAAANFPVEARLVGMVGRLAPVKDVPTFLRAAARVRGLHPEVRYALVGDGPDRPALERVVAELGLSAVVHFFGWRRDLPAVYGDLDVVVNSSLNEGTPVALIEALAAARPVVATAVGGTPDLLAGGRHGLLVPPGDPEALAEAIARTLDDAVTSRARACAGREYVLRQHSADRLLEDIDRLYRGLLASPAGAA